MVSIVKVLKNASQFRIATFVTGWSRDTQVFRYSCAQMTDRLAYIRCGTASTLEKINYTRSKTLGNFVLKGKKVR